MQLWIVKKNFLTRLERSPQNALVMSLFFCSLYILAQSYASFLISSNSLSWSFLCEPAFNILKFSCLMAQFSHMLQLYRKMTCLPVHKLIGWHPNRGLECCSVCPQCHLIAETNLFYLDSPSSPRYAWSHDWTLQLVHLSVGDKGWQPCKWWNTSDRKSVV